MSEFRTQLEAALGKAVTFDGQITRAYDHDLGEMPRPLLAQIRARPDAVAAPRSPAQVAEALRIAGAFRVPVTPRGQGSSGYGGALPTRGGLLLDLCGLDQVLAVDAARATVDVQPGVVWNDLARRLRTEGLDLRICPTSGPSSTVGGWLAMGGIGLGSLRYGSIRDVVLEVDVAGLDGRIETVTGPELELFHQTCGTLGVVTRLRLACRRAAVERSFAVHLPDAAGPERLLAALRPRAPYSLSFVSAGYLAMRAAAEGHSPPIDRGFLAIATYLGEEADDAWLAQAAAACGGTALPGEVAEREWAERFYPMRVKKLGPALLAAEFVIPVERFAEAWSRTEAALSHDRIGCEVFAARDDRLAVLTYLPDPGQDLLAPVRMAKAMIPIRIALRLGGSIYSPGLWFASGTRRLFGAEKHQAVAERKRRVDPHGLLNPGKLRAPRPRWFPVADLASLIALGSAVGAPLARLLPSRRRAVAPAGQGGHR